MILLLAAHAGHGIDLAKYMWGEMLALKVVQITNTPCICVYPCSIELHVLVWPSVCTTGSGGSACVLPC